MRAFSDKQVLAYLAGVLDPALARRLGDELEVDPALRARASALRTRLQEPPERPRWRLPPPGLPVGFAGPEVPTERGFTMGEGAAGMLTVRVQLGDQRSRQVVVLVRAARGWTVLIPATPDEVVPLEALALDEGGRRVVTLPLEEGGPHLVALTLPPLDLPIDWALAPPDRWRALQLLVDQGEVPVVVLDVSGGAGA